MTLENTAAVKSSQKTIKISNAGEDNSWLEKLDFLWLEITNQCNLSCVHCYAGSAPTNPLTLGMEYKDWCSVMEEAASLGCRKIQFIGGEPTVHPHLPDLIVGARRIGFDFIEVYTNGTRLTEELCRHLSENCVNLAVSFYGSQATIHDAVTTRRGSFAKTVSGIERALRYDIPIRVGIISMEENWHDLENTKALLESLGVTNVGTDRLRGIGRGGDRNRVSDPFEELCGACWRGKLSVNSAGEVSPCVFSHFCTVGHIFEGLENILMKPVLHDFRFHTQAKESLSWCTPPECNPWCFPNKGT